MALAKVTDAKDQVTHNAAFLADDTKLWWRNYKFDDEVKGCHTFEISSWVDLQTRLIQFLPSDIEWKVRDALHNLRHIGILRDFIKAHSSLMLEIRNMSEVDRLYYFIKRLKPWAHDELMRQGIKTVAEVYEAADKLTDWHEERSKGNDHTGPPKKGFRKKFCKSNLPHKKCRSHK